MKTIEARQEADNGRRRYLKHRRCVLSRLQASPSSHRFRKRGTSITSLAQAAESGAYSDLAKTRPPGDVIYRHRAE